MSTTAPQPKPSLADRLSPRTADTVAAVLLAAVAALFVLASSRTLVEYSAAGDPYYGTTLTSWAYTHRTIGTNAMVLGYAFLLAAALTGMAAGLLFVERGTTSRAVRGFVTAALGVAAGTGTTIVFTLLSTPLVSAKLLHTPGPGIWLCAFASALALTALVLVSPGPAAQPASTGADTAAAVLLVVFAASLALFTFPSVFPRLAPTDWGTVTFGPRLLVLPVILTVAAAVAAAVLLLKGRTGLGRTAGSFSAAMGFGACVVLGIDAFEGGASRRPANVEVLGGPLPATVTAAVALTVSFVILLAEATRPRAERAARDHREDRQE